MTKALRAGSHGCLWGGETTRHVPSVTTGDMPSILQRNAPFLPVGLGNAGGRGSQPGGFGPGDTWSRPDTVLYFGLSQLGEATKAVVRHFSLSDCT